MLGTQYMTYKHVSYTMSLKDWDKNKSPYRSSLYFQRYSMAYLINDSWTVSPIEDFHSTALVN